MQRGMRSWESLHKRACELCNAGRCIRGRVSCATLPLLTSFGRTPAAHAAAPGGGLLRCTSLRLGSLFAVQDNLRREREPQKPRKRLISAPRRGARRPDAGVRPNAVRRGDAAQRKRLLIQQLRARCTTQTPSYATASGALHNTHALLCNSFGRVAQHTRPLWRESLPHCKYADPPRHASSGYQKKKSPPSASKSMTSLEVAGSRVGQPRLGAR